MVGGVIRNLMLMSADAVCIGTCWLVSVLAYHACGGGYEPAFYLHMWPVIVLWLGVNVLFRLYHGRLFYPGAPFSPVEEMRRLVSSAILVHIGVIAILALMRQTTVGYSRVVIVLSGILTAILAQPMRDVVRRLMMRFSFGQIPVLLVGESYALKRMIRMLRTNAYLGFVPAGYFGSLLHGETRVPRVGAEGDILRVSRRLGVRILFVCEDGRLLERRQHKFSRWFTHVAYFPKRAVFPVSGSRMVTMNGIGGIEMVSQSRMSVLRFEKWALDKTLAILAFIAALPLLIVIAAVVMVTSPGGAFFQHERLGRHGRRIKIWKFRTMYADAEERLERILATDPAAAAEWKSSFKLRHDPRVTLVGRFLRRTSLDELPQLLNVLCGSMALVGPRPIVKSEIHFYGKSFEIFSSVKPGLTGLWQVSGRSDCDYSRRVALDTYYVLNWSPWLDIWITIRTIYSVVLMRGAR